MDCKYPKVYWGQVSVLTILKAVFIMVPDRHTALSMLLGAMSGNSDDHDDAQLDGGSPRKCLMLLQCRVNLDGKI
jgi:hypothetical protein